jgi:hypothetical protein
MDGFYVAKFRKFADGVKSVEAVSTAQEEEVVRAEKRVKKRKENAKKKDKRAKKKAKKELIAEKIKEEKKSAKDNKATGEEVVE